jgi:hypothetical protein
MMRKGSLLSIISLLLVSSLSSISYAAGPPSSLEINISDYEVTTAGGLDYVEIPGGEVLLTEEGRPRVPYYTTSIDYPEGYKVQDVTLKERSGLETASGLNLPVVILSPSPELPIEMKTGWYPEEDYNWRVWENPDGSTTLVIMMYPFYYDPETTTVKFYKNYSFDIEYIFSNVTIRALSTDKDVYEPGDKVTLDMRLNNSGETQDVVVSIIIKQYGSDEIVDGLPLRSLKNVVGDASLTTEWDSNGAETSYYYAEAILTDTAGNMLDKYTVGFGIQVSEAPEKPIPTPTTEKPAPTPTTEKPASTPTTEKQEEFPTLYYVIIGAIVVVAVIASVIVIRSRKTK